MPQFLRMLAAVIVTLAGFSVAHAQAPEPRIALVIGNSAYQAGSLATPANDAGLVAQTLTQAGFEVIGARDLDQDGLRRSFRDFLDKAAASGPDTVAFVYLAGYGLQYAGENYFAPIEAVISRDSSVPLEALRIADFTRALADIPLKARFVVLDAARANPFAPAGQPLAGGLALVEAEQGALISFNAAPGTIPPPATGDYGPYAKALSEMMHEGGLDAAGVFGRVRLRVSEQTRGAQAPWHVSRLAQPFVFFERDLDAPPSVAQAPRSVALRDLPVAEAYAVALERDTITAYQEFLTAFPRDPLSPRVEAMLAARREAVTWRRAVARNTPSAYWSYIRRYPRGPHLADAHRRLAILSASLEPPAVFDEYDFGLPPPPPEEYVFLSGPVMVFDEAYYPPPPPIYFLPPPRREYIELPPPRFASPGFLPIPVPIFLPSARPWRQDIYRQPPPVRLPVGVSPRDPGVPPRFIAPPPQRPRPLPDVSPPFQRPLPPSQNPQAFQPVRPVPLVSPQQMRQQELQARRQQDLQRQRQLQAQRLQMQREQQMRGQELRRQREQQVRAQQQYRQREQQLRTQQQYQQREQQLRAQQQVRQREQQMRSQQQMQQQSQQREQQMRAQQQMQQQRALQLRSQQQQQQLRSQQQQQQMQMQRQQQMQQQQMQQRQIQQQMQRQREQQQRAQPQQQQRQYRTDCGGPGKPPCR